MAKALFWCRIPFTYGNVRKDRQEVESSQSSEPRRAAEYTEHGEDTQRIVEEEELEEEEKEEGVGDVAESTIFDGLISSIQMLITLVVVASVFILPTYDTRNENGTMSRKLALGFLMSLGLVLMTCIYRHRATFLHPEPPEGKAIETVGHSDRDNLTPIGIMTFCVLGCLYNFVQVVDLIICSGEWIACQRRNIVGKQIVKIIFCLVRIIYLAGQTFFCLIFNQSTFSNRSPTRHALMYLQAVNVIFWFQAMIAEAGHLLRHVDEDHEHSHLVQLCFANGTTNRTGELLQCLGSNSTLHRFVHRYAIPILRPFLIEYSLLIGECLVHWFLCCGGGGGGETDHENEPVVRRGIGRRSTGGAGADAQGIVNGASSQIEENAGSVISTGNDAEVSDHDSAKEDDERTPLLSDRVLLSSDGSRPLALMLGLGLAVISNLILFVFAFLPKLLHDVGDMSLDRIFDESYYYYMTLYYSLMIIIVALGYGLTGQFKVKPRVPFTGLDYLLIFTSLGPLAINAFRFQATLWAKKRSANSDLIGVYRASIFLEIVQSAFQVAFVLYAGRIRVEKRPETTTRRNFFRAIVFYLALCNGTLWCTNTFSAGLFGKHYLGEYFGETGRGIILVVLAPLSLFFRFNSCLLFARIFVQTRSKRQKRQGRRRE